ncbi:hypothetical protein RFI_09180 [Reticulomyxa filosa]|uniref:non-specific serine/threonine protein kinase n=1 Tax=Reticulomyxa filosa TaxID=46433 RepID=X6NQJ4_RETFI|nr:hypothetical protein RFI_09180 [Reticulomyxa filosa]|eukprot:ETO27959.1 hypothetical protein RFI_09180 [Reticulomyxa filosa]
MYTYQSIVYNIFSAKKKKKLVLFICLYCFVDCVFKALIYRLTCFHQSMAKQFVQWKGLEIVTGQILKNKSQHADDIIVKMLQTISQTARISSDFYPIIEKTGIIELIPNYLKLSSSQQNPEIVAKTCNLVGNLFKHSSHFLSKIQQLVILTFFYLKELLNLLCSHCSHSDPDVRRFACYAIGNMSFHCRDSVMLSQCFRPLSHCLGDQDYKTQENAAGAIGNLIRTPADQILVQQIVDNKIIPSLLKLVLCLLYFVTNKQKLVICYVDILSKFSWRLIIKKCGEEWGSKDELITKYALRVLGKMHTNVRTKALSDRHIPYAPTLLETWSS